jgi:hypothetical protein
MCHICYRFVCIYYVRTRCSCLFILMYFKQALMCYKGIVPLFQKIKKNIYLFFVARFTVFDVVMSHGYSDIIIYVFFVKDEALQK